MVSTLTFLSAFFILLSLMPFSRNQHWVFRAAEFIKFQLLVLQLITFVLVFFYTEGNGFLWYFQAVQFLCIVYHVFVLIKFTPFWKVKPLAISGSGSGKIKLISCNVYQFNSEYGRFINLIKQEKPDIFLTMESHGEWEKAMRVLESDYPNCEKVSLENTYGMHFYTHLKVNSIRTHYFVADDLPSIEAELETQDGYRFIFFGVHPPPPSPTEEENSKERDGDLLSIAKKAKEHTLPVLVAGDFNNVAWARASILFKKTSELIDARIGRGILATFHAKYWFFRIPLDLLFHSPEIYIDDLSVCSPVGSDHLPVACIFHIDTQSEEQKARIDQLEPEEKQEIEVLIQEGKEEESDNRKDY
ncbi:endonuclease/exonuclease/phosphatase family protein [Marinilongibacter aquaticus]|uniref:endonuclease/exonuclease/phosphatase family protein n=1 Tax=Marinilongibacter aquaticus TaxID=2975157 RepID=UPI0021BD2D6F|nr:endonuclease/exonuclease/phosphatase family protein [Marinilongibacter aquaticus]UBM60745.1 endonuclease/exonuclease/phosphatase family protein [Marinilongibacter aquaticus]